jgi:hypothetical protein
MVLDIDTAFFKNDRALCVPNTFQHQLLWSTVRKPLQVAWHGFPQFLEQKVGFTFQIYHQSMSLNVLYLYGFYRNNDSWCEVFPRSSYSKRRITCTVLVTSTTYVYLSILLVRTVVVRTSSSTCSGLQFAPVLVITRTSTCTCTCSCTCTQEYLYC